MLASGCHGSAALGAAPASVNAFLHVSQLLAISGALVADFGALAAGMPMVWSANEHEVSARSADLSARHHQPEVSRFDVTPARL
jgi:hypothetical protein